MRAGATRAIASSGCTWNWGARSPRWWCRGRCRWRPILGSATSVSMDPTINFGGGRPPLAADIGFALPETFSGATSFGRFGPNFLFTPVPAPSSLALLGLGGLAATRRRR